MKRKSFPKNRKAPVAVVLCSFLLAACASEEGIEYDIPAGEQIQDLQLQIDADGTPVLLVEEGMFYTTKAPLGPWDGKYVQPNVQSVALTRTASGWKRHPFRNIKRNWNAHSMLVRNGGDRIQTLISDRDRFSLHSRNGAGWNMKAQARISGGFESMPISMMSGGYAFMTDGDGAWQSLNINYKSGGVEVRRNDGTAFALDTLMFSPMSLVSRETFNMAFCTNSNPHSPNVLQGPDSGKGGSGFFSYSWNVGSADPKPRKRNISDREYTQLFFAKVQGQERMYALTGRDTLAEYSMQGDDLTWLRDIVISRSGRSGSKEEAPSDSGYPPSANVAVDPNGCIHYFASASGAPAGYTGLTGQPDYLHGSDCRAGVDTLRLPVPDTALAYHSRLTPFRFAPDGGIMVGLLLVQTPKNPNSYIEGAARSWVFTATLSGRTWQIEKVLEYAGSGEKERPFGQHH